MAKVKNPSTNASFQDTGYQPIGILTFHLRQDLPLLTVPHDVIDTVHDEQLQCWAVLPP